MPNVVTRRLLRRQLTELGLAAGDTVMAHAALRKVGRVLGGPDSLISAIRDAIGPDGTLMAYTDWNGGDDNIWDDQGRVPEELKPEVAPFDPLVSRSTWYNGSFVELVRTTPGALRSGSPGASCAAIGARAQWLTENHPIDYGYGPGSPLAKLVEAGGKVLMLGNPLDTMTLLHHAEHLADIPGKRIVRSEVPFLDHDQKIWRWVEEFETSIPVVDGLPEDYFVTIVEAFLSTGRGSRGMVGNASSVLVSAPEVVAFAVDWLESRFAVAR